MPRQSSLPEPDVEQRQADWTRRAGALFLLLQGTGALVWWAAILLFPEARRPFFGSRETDALLISFIPGDLVLFVAGSLAGAWGLLRGRSWTWPVLCVHAGAAAYAALFSLTLPIVSGEGWGGAGLMAPSLVIPLYLAWRLRPEK